jgi:phenylpropionate dioxygenase-like ring-hydroxylating dioxygenase large terminal subunit
MNIPVAALLAAALCSGRNDAFQSPLSRAVRRQHSRVAVAASSVTVDAPPLISATVVEQDSSSNEDSSEFNWFKAWYPIVPVEFLDYEKPHAFKLLGMDIVIWNDGELSDSPAYQSRKERTKNAKKLDGNWRVFVDQCPHRKVPLSEGRVEDDGSLTCSYHAWRFNGGGETIHVPQISENELEIIKANPKSNCNSFPVQIVDGVLWTWPDSSDDAKIESALTPIPRNDYNGKEVDEDRVWKGVWNFRELPYGHDFFIENVVDPAHVPVSHHNVVGSRYGDLGMTLTTKTSLTKDGFSIGNKNRAGEGSESIISFTAPSQVLIEASFGNDGAAQYLELYSSPSRPGFSNHVGRIVILKDKSLEMPKLLKQFTLPLPKWLNHIVASAFLHQDALFLHGQERSLAHNREYRTSQPANDSYSKAVMPCSSDKGVMNFRNWMSKFAGGYIPFRGDTSMPAKNNDVVFDVWNSHTKHCSYCLTALKRLKMARKLAFLTSALIATIRPKFLNVFGSVVSSLGFAGVGFGLSKLIGMFYKYEFSHADNH